ncbi:hypothetical protein PoB_001107000 [Plakobranchus ocellatus]|uniref:Uncharacterized protein n=1 Tax=Plakobranchus ocellatus TaxID=259542 RepID=A0AAV3YQ46_9GAST|nr:hypothetical protein PoB_001107000 [Plakobranchus ocellatus]
MSSHGKGPALKHCETSSHLVIGHRITISLRHGDVMKSKAVALLVLTSITASSPDQLEFGQQHVFDTSDSGPGWISELRALTSDLTGHQSTAEALTAHPSLTNK